MDQMDDVMASPMIERVNGQDVTFARLLNEDYGTLENAVRQLRVSFLNDLIAKAKLEGTDKFCALRDNYTPFVDATQVAAYLRTHDGARKAVMMSLKKSGYTEESAKEIMSHYFFSDLSDLAWSLIGFAERNHRVGPSEKGEKPTDPTGAPAENLTTGAGPTPNSESTTPESTPPS